VISSGMPGSAFTVPFPGSSGAQSDNLIRDCPQVHVKNGSFPSRSRNPFMWSSREDEA
jgi:hypothetical protein